MDWRPEDDSEPSTENDENGPVEINQNEGLEAPQEIAHQNQPNDLNVEENTEMSESEEYDDDGSDYDDSEVQPQEPANIDLGVSRYGRVRVARRDKDFIYQPP